MAIVHSISDLDFPRTLLTGATYSGGKSKYLLAQTEAQEQNYYFELFFVVLYFIHFLAPDVKLSDG